MFRFGKKKRFTIGEKLGYFNRIINNNNETQKRKTWASLRISQLEETKNKMKLGDVFVINDRHLGNSINKPRAVVIAKQKDQENVQIIPVYKEKKFMFLSNFDGQRMLNMNNATIVNKNKLYINRGFKVMKKAYLTPQEKNRLQNKVVTYL